MSSFLSHTPRPMLLCILDGWGENPHPVDNAIANAQTPFWDYLVKTYPHTLLETSGLSVGLPEGQMGNSEVGHMNIGSGRVVMQDLPRIDQAIEDSTIYDHPELIAFVKTLCAQKRACHLLGLLSDGGVHAHHKHLLMLAKMIASWGVTVYVHAILDGRDTPPASAGRYLAEWQLATASMPLIKIATISGRYYAMDRDNRWDRIEHAYRAIVQAKGPQADDAEAALQTSYRHGVTDEFVLPTIIGGYPGMQDGDGLLMANFRSDRAREILTALLDPSFQQFPRENIVSFSAALGMVEYSTSLNQWMKCLFPPQSMEHSLPSLLAEKGLTQLRIAETEKYAHVTFFFSGGREALLPGEKRILVPSPKVDTYDQKPEMSALEVTEKLIEAIQHQSFDFIVVNYANGDMVGHTGNMAASIKAIEALDHCLSKLVPALLEVGGAMIITADHGNAEQMVDPYTQVAHTAHTTNPVPCILISQQLKNVSLRPGKLADIAPTILELMQLETPKEMTGNSLILSK